MDTCCVLCNEPMGLRAIAALVVMGNVEHPEGGALCRRCAALPPEEQRRRRNLAMVRMLREESVATR